MEGRGNLEFVALFPVPGSRRSHGRVRHIAHIPKCQFRTPVSEALTMNNFFFAAEARTPSRPVRFPGVGWIRAGRERGRIRELRVRCGNDPRTPFGGGSENSVV